MAQVHVRDDGAGIAPELLNELFEPFVQAEATLDRSKGGLGLGLALVKGLVELHGGTVVASSGGPGQGAEFTLRLPAERAQWRAALRAAPPEEAGRKDALLILLVEDNTDAAESLKEVLELSGHQVELAATGPSGVERAKELHPDIVVCDIGLPGFDGFEVARRMRADPELCRAPLVALSGTPLPRTREVQAGRLRGTWPSRRISRPWRTRCARCGRRRRRGREGRARPGAAVSHRPASAP
jgi:CheY-like chemotaxis protein